MRQAAVVFRNPAIAVELLAPARDLPFVPVVGFAEITEPDRLMVDRSERDGGVHQFLAHCPTPCRIARVIALQLAALRKAFERLHQIDRKSTRLNSSH